MATSSSGSGSSQSSAFSQPTLMPTLDDPRLGDLFKQIQGVTPTSLPSLDSIVQEGMNSPLMSQILSGALARAAPNEALARQGVTDAARASGGLRGTAYMQGVARNEGNILDQRGILTSDIISKTLQQLISGRLQEQQNSFLPARTLTDLLQAGRPLSGQTSSQQSTSNWGQQGSGADDFGISGGQSWEEIQARLAGYPSAAAKYAADARGTPPAPNNPPASNIANPAPNPYGGYGFPGTGPQGGAPTSFAPNQGGPEYGPWSPTTYGSNPSAPQYGQPGANWTPNTGPGTGSWAGYPPQDQYTAQPGIFQNFPGRAPSYDNPYAGWEPAEPVPYVSGGGEY